MGWGHPCPGVLLRSAGSCQSVEVVLLPRLMTPGHERFIRDVAVEGLWVGLVVTVPLSPGRSLSCSFPCCVGREEHQPARDPPQHQHRRHQHQSAQPVTVHVSSPCWGLPAEQSWGPCLLPGLCSCGIQGLMVAEGREQWQGSENGLGGPSRWPWAQFCSGPPTRRVPFLPPVPADVQPLLAGRKSWLGEGLPLLGFLGFSVVEVCL